MFISKLLFISFVMYAQAIDSPKNVSCKVSRVTTESILITCDIQPPFAYTEYSAYFTSNNTTWNFTSEVENNCTSERPYVNVTQVNNKQTTCLLKINTTQLESGNYDIKLTASAEGNDSSETDVESDSIRIYFPKEIQTPVCTEPQYDEENCPSWPKKTLCILCVAAVPPGEVDCRLFYTSGSMTGSVYNFGAKPHMLADTDNSYTYAAKCTKTVTSSMLNDGIDIRANFTKYIDYGNTSVRSIVSASFFFETPKKINFTVNDNPIGVCANIGENVTLKCATDGAPTPRKFLELGPSLDNVYIVNNFPEPVMTWTIRSSSIYGYFMCYADQYEQRISKSVYVVAPDQILGTESQKNYKLQYTGHNYDTSYVLIGVTGCPEPSSLTLFRKKNNNVKEALTDGVSLSYKSTPQIVKSSNQYKALGFVNVTFLNKHMTLDSPTYFLHVSNGISNYTIFEFSVYGAHNSSATPLSNSLTIFLLVLALFNVFTF
ncbi:hypothetical protein BgiBS90_019120 [Biomphalaria glabrata]|nr:hypothetical protein BgiBS90_019120 [Biomphalaria glabrata]